MSRTASPVRSPIHGIAALRNEARVMHKSPITFVNVGWLCVIAALVLNFVGIVSIGTAPGAVEAGYGQRQILHLCVGLFAAIVVAAPHYQRLRRLSYAAMIAVLVLLVFVLIPQVPDALVRPRNGARRWISIVVMDFQPSELAKIAYVLALANYLRFRRNYRTFLGLLLPLLLTFIPMGLVLIEPDLGTAMLFLPTLFAMLLAAGAKIRHLLIIIAIGLSLAPAMYPLLKPHQKDRILAMVAQVRGDERYVNDIGYQGARAMTLVGAGQLTGVGREKAMDLIEYNHLPESHNDMIFAVICCRWGLVGAMVTWTLFAGLCMGGVLTAAQCKDPFGRLVVVGLTAVLFAQVTINNGMTIGLMPITGMTLPFVSYGGSSLVTAWIMIGLIFNIARRRPQYLSRHSFEFDDPELDDRYGIVHTP